MEGGKINILLVEDDVTAFLDIRDFLQEEGYEVLSLPGRTVIDSYETAVAACKQAIPHLAILDIMLSGKRDGLELAAYIREHFFSPVVILSGKEGDGFIRRAVQIGVDNYIVKADKPYDLKQLAVTIKRLLPLAADSAKKRTSSAFLHVRDAVAPAGESEFYLQKRIEWAALKFITTDKAHRNNLVLEMANGQQYIYRSSITEFKTLLPPVFVQVSNFLLVNASFFDAKGKSSWVYFIGNKKFEIAPAYRSPELEAFLNRMLT